MGHAKKHTDKKDCWNRADPVLCRALQIAAKEGLLYQAGLQKVRD